MGSVDVRKDDGTSYILCVVLDLSFPTDGILYKKCHEALENVLAWALCAPHKVSLVGVTTLSPQQRPQFAPLDDNFAAISSLLSVVFKNAGHLHEHMTSGDLSDSLFLTTKQVALHLRERHSLEDGQVVATVVTCRDGGLVCDAVHDALDGLHDDVARCFDAMTVVQLSSEPSAQTRFSVRGAEGGTPVRLAVVPVAADAAGPEPRTPRSPRASSSLPRLETALRSAWFTPRWSQLLPLELELGRATALQCVASQCVLDLARLPVWDHFALVAGGADAASWRCGGPRVLRAVSRVAAEGVCEGSTFGPPLRLTWAPSTAFRRRDDYNRNAHLFLALCDSLADRGQEMVVRLQTGAQPTAASGHFMLTPGDACMLLRAVTSAELCLPPPPAPAMQYDGALAAWAEQEAGGVLDALPVEEQYLSKDHPSGLCSALRLTASFPKRLPLQQAKPAVPAPADAVDAQPPEDSPPAASADDVVLVVSSDDDDLPEVNVRAKALTACPAAASHKPGTGGHPALQDDFGAPPPAKRGRFQPLSGVFKSRRQ